MFDCGDVFPLCVFVVRIRVIGNGYGVVLPVSCLIVEMCFQCVYLL